MAEYEVTKMEGVDETDPEISFKVRVVMLSCFMAAHRVTDPFG